MFIMVAKTKNPHMSMHPCRVNNTHVIHLCKGNPTLVGNYSSETPDTTVAP